MPPCVVGLSSRPPPNKNWMRSCVSVRFDVETFYTNRPVFIVATSRLMAIRTRAGTTLAEARVT